MSAQTFELFVAARYLRAKRKQAVISVITVISIVGVAAGVMALVIGLAINNGFRTTLQQSLLGTTAHELAAAQDQIVLLGRKTAKERVASFLVSLSDRALKRRQPASPLDVPMTRTDSPLSDATN